MGDRLGLRSTEVLMYLINIRILSVLVDTTVAGQLLQKELQYQSRHRDCL